MTKKIIFITLTFATVSYASVGETISNETTLVNKEGKTYQAFPSHITDNVSGETCSDGNCLTGSKFFTKDGSLYKCAKRAPKNIKKFFKKI